MQLEIRFGEAADLPAVLSWDKHFDRELLQWKLTRQEVVVAEADGQMIGYLRLEYIWSTVPYIGLILVSEPYRKKGAGKGMVSFVEEYLRERSHPFLYSSSQANEAEPQSWHRHAGFNETGIIAGMNEGGIGEVFFRKQL
ncbi:GNAT family N-acetyltransferase [Paenibacillus sp. HJL G12]|uniref:GNAT family N-acetyltransferase n=1 Tax=Paenibacillus dendrobii TaxID=2691084 RepID=A0A7X3IHX3_9BACL|nr:GNAT family N-acetyltransferase [Paenibacillus dendrobii]MWV44268.1 GNAT family N-acetyltransferase [Paenibacillus dendrobii]